MQILSNFNRLKKLVYAKIYPNEVVVLFKVLISLSDSHFQVRSFVKHLSWHQNYFGMDYSPGLSIYLPIMPYPPINIEIFSTPLPHAPPFFNILKTTYPPFVNGGFQTMKTVSRGFFSPVSMGLILVFTQLFYSKRLPRSLKLGYTTLLSIIMTLQLCRTATKSLD